MFVCYYAMWCYAMETIHARFWQLLLQKLLPNANQLTEWDKNIQVKIVSSSKTSDD